MENATKSIEEIQSSLFEISCNLEKAKGLFDILGDKTYLHQTKLDEKDRLFLIAGHENNGILYSAVNDYLFESLNQISDLSKELKEYINNVVTSDC